MMHPVIFNTSRVFSQKGVSHVVLSPGSRNAPLTTSFARNPDIRVFNIIDERSAGFIALGMAQKGKMPVVLCCTSGTALLNYAPAVAEACYQQIPLIILSADRPPEWQGQRDGQTIYQPGALANFVKRTVTLPAQFSCKDEEWEYVRKLNEAINLASESPAGPVHINVPFREPFYPDEHQRLVFDDSLKIIEPVRFNPRPDLSELLDSWKKSTKRLIICGQYPLDQQLSTALKVAGEQAVVVSDIISNANALGIRHHDLFLHPANRQLCETLQPDLVVSYGKSVISKNLKLFLRKYKPAEHWHFDDSMIYADTFQSMTRMIKCDPRWFFEALERPDDKLDEFHLQLRNNFIQNWKIEDQKANRTLHLALDSVKFCEFKAFRQVMESLPGDIDLHLANSMPVRFANFIQGLAPKTEVFCNRGTSGIDGTNGTATGNALVSDKQTVLLSGDLSFLYDRNAFFHHYDLSNLKIIVFNNKGGGIFRLINGPSRLPELELHFEARHNHSARFSALEFGFDYFSASTTESLSKALKEAFKSHKSPKLIEVFTEPEINQRAYHAVKKMVHDQDSQG